MSKCGAKSTLRKDDFSNKSVCATKHAKIKFHSQWQTAKKTRATPQQGHASRGKSARDIRCLHNFFSTASDPDPMFIDIKDKRLCSFVPVNLNDVLAAMHHASSDHQTRCQHSCSMIAPLHWVRTSSTLSTNCCQHANFKPNESMQSCRHFSKRQASKSQHRQTIEPWQIIRFYPRSWQPTSTWPGTNKRTTCFWSSSLPNVETIQLSPSWWRCFPTSRPALPPRPVNSLQYHGPWHPAAAADKVVWDPSEVTTVACSSSLRTTFPDGNYDHHSLPERTDNQVKDWRTGFWHRCIAYMECIATRS